MRRLGVPRRAITIVEGESLVNDGTALVLYRVAVTAAVAGTFSFWEASWRLVWSVVGGVAIGLVVGFLVAFVRRRIDNPPVEVTIALITGYLAFIPANAAQASGVLAVVTAGVYLGWRTPELTSFQTRLSGSAVWEIFTFVLNALLFVLSGCSCRASSTLSPGYAGDGARVVGGARHRHGRRDAARVRARVHVLAETVRGIVRREQSRASAQPFGGRGLGRDAGRRVSGRCTGGAFDDGCGQRVSDSAT